MMNIPLIGVAFTIARYLWVAPCSAVGLIVAFFALFTDATFRIRFGVLEVYGGAAGHFLRVGIPFVGGMPAMTFGHVILARNRHGMKRWRRHEMVHVKQAEAWGPFFLPAFVLCSLWMWIVDKDPYYDNPFEREAYGRVAKPQEVACLSRRSRAKARALRPNLVRLAWNRLTRPAVVPAPATVPSAAPLK